MRIDRLREALRTENETLPPVDAVAKQRERLQIMARTHFPVIWHSKGVVCRCGRVFRDDILWSEHLSEEMIP